jgi:hypothetical protein
VLADSNQAMVESRGTLQLCQKLGLKVVIGCNLVCNSLAPKEKQALMQIGSLNLIVIFK